MAIQELIDVVPPPPNPKETGNLLAWRAVEDQLEITLPADYRDLR